MNMHKVEFTTKTMNKRNFRYFFDRMALKVTKASGKPAAFILGMRSRTRMAGYWSYF
jgi:hypothetical protein